MATKKLPEQKPRKPRKQRAPKPEQPDALLARFTPGTWLFFRNEDDLGDLGIVQRVVRRKDGYPYLLVSGGRLVGLYDVLQVLTPTEARAAYYLAYEWGYLPAVHNLFG